DDGLDGVVFVPASESHCARIVHLFEGRVERLQTLQHVSRLQLRLRRRSCLVDGTGHRDSSSPSAVFRPLVASARLAKSSACWAVPAALAAASALRNASLTRCSTVSAPNRSRPSSMWRAVSTNCPLMLTSTVLSSSVAVKLSFPIWCTAPSRNDWNRW